jgi:hypothetical protein
VEKIEEEDGGSAERTEVVVEGRAAASRVFEWLPCSLMIR